MNSLKISKTFIQSIILIMIIGIFVGASYWAAQYIQQFGFDRFKEIPIIHLGKQLIYWPILGLIYQTILNPIFYGFIPLIFALEHFFPADPKQKIFNVVFAQDIIWFILEAFLRASILVTYVSFLSVLFQKYLGFLTIQAISQWPEVTRFIWGILLSDFVKWAHHYLRHKVLVFWEFHKIHHSQRELNVFTDMRYHIVEYVIAETIKIFVMLMLAVNIPDIVAWGIFQMWYTRFYHGNIKTNLGPLRYILVTPQSHRIHHSIESRHQDKNFGVVFSIWDYIFKTQYKGYDEYPQTGIDDQNFPHEMSMKWRDLIKTPFVQLAYPFQAIAKNFKRKV